MASPAVAAPVEPGPGPPAGDASAPVKAVPEEWKAERAAKANEWFLKAREASLRKWHDGRTDASDTVAAAAAAVDNEAAAEQCLRQFRIAHDDAAALAAESISERLELVADAHEGSQLLRAPHYTAVRPIVVLSHSCAGFKEKLFVRALVSTLLGHAVAVPPGDSKGSGSGSGCGSGSGVAAVGLPPVDELVWWDVLQPRVAMRERSLARLEALSRACCVLVVLSPGYVSSPEFAEENELVMARLLGSGPHAHLLVLRYSPDVRIRPPSLQLPSQLPTRHTLRQPLPQSSSATGSRCMRLTIPKGSAPMFVQLELGVGNGIEEQVVEALMAIQPLLPEVSGVALPRGNGLTVYFHPLDMLEAAPALLEASLAPTATSLATLPSAAPPQAGASWAASYRLPKPLYRKAVEEWSVHDVQVWIQSHGASFARFCQPFLRYGVDGWLLADVDDATLAMLGVDSVPARSQLLAALKAMLRKTANLNSTGNLLPPKTDAVELFTMSDYELRQVWRDQFRYYDKAGTGSINGAAVNTLLAAAGIQLEPKKAAQVLAEYDTNDDGLLGVDDALSLLEDVWRLLVASRDAAAWNMRCTHDLMEEELEAGVEVGLGLLSVGERGTHGMLAGSASHAVGGASMHDSVSVLDRRRVQVHQQRMVSDLDAGGGSRPKAPPRKALVASDPKQRASVRISAGGAPWGGAVSRQASRCGSAAVAAARGDAGSAGGSLLAMPWGGGQAADTASVAGALVAAVQKMEEAVDADGPRTARTFQSAADEPARSKKRSSNGKSARFDERTLKHEGGGVPPRPSVKVPAPASSVASAKWARVSFANGSADAAAPLLVGVPASPARTGASGMNHAGSAMGGSRPSSSKPRGSAPSDGRSLVGTAAAVAELDAFFEADAGMTMMRHTSDVDDLHEKLAAALTAADARHAGRLPAGVLRQALGSKLPHGTLSPYELRMLAALTPVAPRGTGPLAATLREVDIAPFVGDGVAAVEAWQRELMERVYMPGSGIRAALWQLYLQLRPLPQGCVPSDDGVIVVQSKPPGKDDFDVLVEGMPPLELDEGLALLDVIITTVLKLQVKLPLLVGCGLLLEAAHEAAESLGTGHEVNAWAAFVAHMLTVYLKLSGAGEEGAPAGELA